MEGKTAWVNGEKITGEMNLKQMLASNKNAFGGKGVSWNGFIVGHKYLALYVSNYWGYANSQAYINSGAEDIEVLLGGSPESRNEIWASGAVLTFTATNTNITINYEYSPDYYTMRFIDITTID